MFGFELSGSDQVLSSKKISTLLCIKVVYLISFSIKKNFADFENVQNYGKWEGRRGYINP